jgi:hypothetical protein
MLPQDARLRGRLFGAARVLVGWDQARLAAEAGSSAAAVGAGVRFIPAAGPLGPGLRYSPAGQGDRAVDALGARGDAA